MIESIISELLEWLIYIIIFGVIGVVGFFLKKISGNESDERTGSEKKEIPSIHKSVLNKQKSYRKSNKEYPASVSLQTQLKDACENSKKSSVQTENADKDFNDLPKNDKLISFNKKTLKDAVILKEILDLPVALR
jgi:hypothetical protein